MLRTAEETPGRKWAVSSWQEISLENCLDELERVSETSQIKFSGSQELSAVLWEEKWTNTKWLMLALVQLPKRVW